jgi:hypothetical protein
MQKVHCEPLYMGLELKIYIIQLNKSTWRIGELNKNNNLNPQNVTVHHAILIYKSLWVLPCINERNYTFCLLPML